MSSNAESDLIACCRRGEADAWDEIFKTHYAATGRFVFQLGADWTREDVEEICQETFLTAIKNIDTFRGNSQFQTWLFRIAANKARDFRERHHALKRGGGQLTVSLQAEDEENGLTIDPPTGAASPDARLMIEERLACVRTCRTNWATLVARSSNSGISATWSTRRLGGHLISTQRRSARA